jgi:hypothetical protein
VQSQVSIRSATAADPVRAVPAQAHGDRAIALGGEKVEKVFGPTPGGMLSAVDEKQWCIVGFTE